MSDYVLTPQAREDLFEVWDYIAQDRPAAADRVAEEIRNTALLLAERPGIGRPPGGSG